MIEKVMQKEMDAIKIMLNSVASKDTTYDAVLDLFSSCKGKVVFMGVGKSAHIGEKLAATFASLGTPSFFVHSTEAMHGDLGMIGKSDVAVLISNSGTTKEVLQNLAPLKANGVTTVAFTSVRESELARSCDYQIFYPKLPEADQNNLAPTVSSTLTLVLGDAIACELSERKNFTRSDFYAYHPNGALGEALSKEKTVKLHE